MPEWHYKIMKSKFLIKIKKLISWKYFSAFESIFKWSWLEITDARKYSPGDPYKYINRKNTAKHSELWTSIFQQEKDITLDVFFDVNYNRKSGDDIKNREKVIEFRTDIIVYCTKNGIRMKIFYVETVRFRLQNLMPEWQAKIRCIDVGKHTEKAYQFIDTLNKLVRHTPKRYQSWLDKFIQIAKENKKRRAMVIFSDFLEVSSTDKNVLEYFAREHFLALIKIPVNKLQGQNYNKFVIDMHHPLDVENLQTVEL